MPLLSLTFPCTGANPTPTYGDFARHTIGGRSNDQSIGPLIRHELSLPMWAWAKPKSCNSDGSPDLRSHRSSEPQALLCLESPSTEFLLSNHGSWHHILNAWPLSLSEAENEACEAQLSQISGRPFNNAQRTEDDFSNPLFIQCAVKPGRFRAVRIQAGVHPPMSIDFQCETF